MEGLRVEEVGQSHRNLNTPTGAPARITTSPFTYHAWHLFCHWEGGRGDGDGKGQQKDKVQPGLPTTRSEAAHFPSSGRLTPVSRRVHLIVGPSKNLPELLGQNILPKLGLRVARRPCV